jgi:TetR/AcrR family transcriptional regulator, cholesterol catabolism regulator
LEYEQVKRRNDKPAGENLRRPRRKSIHRRAEILHHARRLFEQAGFHETSFDDIARAVGIRREGLYYYYRSRAEILLDLVRPQNETLVQRLTAINASRLAPATKLYLAIKNHLAMFDRLGLDMVMLGIGGAKVPAGDPEVDSVHVANRPLYRSYQDLWVKLIRDGQHDGTFDPSIDAKLVVFAILGMCNWTGAWLDPKGPRSLSDIAGTFFTMVSGGLVVSEEDGVSETLLREAEAFEASLSD